MIVERKNVAAHPSPAYAQRVAHMPVASQRVLTTSAELLNTMCEQLDDLAKRRATDTASADSA